MKRPTIDQRAEYLAILNDDISVVQIPGTRKKVRISTPHQGTINALTKVWVERDLAAKKLSTGAEVLKDLAQDPCFGVKEACILVLNSWWKLKLIYPLKWRWWAYIRQFTDEQMEPIILEGKKKLPLMAHYRLMAFSMDMRADWMTMTKKEAEQYRAELLSEEKQLSSKTSPNTGGQGISSSAS